ncbi:murein hydrolase activator EnvC family protein [Flavicella sediminum]|uniref:murein hydrolase activator EnvC family protein n=1 Tax=Flavicella sediminum TaxID=2585141 RepID=UPI001123E7F1|nr:peptidoglycan DD-metalloendopeptidase family protein [Flavicella sediminum]
MQKTAFLLSSFNPTKNLGFIKYLLLFLFVFSTAANYAQSTSQKTLEKKRTQLQEEIKKINSLLFNTKKEEKNLLEHVNDLKQKINVRSKLIATIDKQADNLNAKINSNSKKIKSLNKDLDVLKEDYANMIYKSYKSKSLQSRMMFLFSSDNFLQAYKRIKYMDQYTDYRKKQGEEIAKKTKEIEILNESLKVQQQEKEALVIEHREEQAIIEQDKKEQEVLVKKVKSKGNKYLAEIKAKQKEERKIDAQIEKLIREAIAASKKKSSTNTTKGFFLTPEAKALASKFTSNKGKLPWPVINALVVRDFGKIASKIYSGIYHQSNGIHIATNNGASAKAIFEGTVLAIQMDTSGLKTVMIQHGNYISIYKGLDTVTIQKGDRVNVNQSLGKIHTDKVTGKTILKFQIWKDNMTKENPKYWLLRL